MTIDFFVPGIPRPAGSKKAFALKSRGIYTGRVAVVDACKESRDWKTRVSREAATAFERSALMEGPLQVSITFFVSRPKGHFRTGKNADSIRDSAPKHPTTRPDVLKLARAVEDAITGVIWRDDSQIVDERIRKEYSDKPGVGIVIGELQ